MSTQKQKKNKGRLEGMIFRKTNAPDRASRLCDGRQNSLMRHLLMARIILILNCLRFLFTREARETALICPIRGERSQTHSAGREFELAGSSMMPSTFQRDSAIEGIHESETDIAEFSSEAKTQCIPSKLYACGNISRPGLKFKARGARFFAAVKVKCVMRRTWKAGAWLAGLPLPTGNWTSGPPRMNTPNAGEG